MRKYKVVLSVFAVGCVWGGLAVASQSGQALSNYTYPQIAVFKSWVGDHARTIWGNVENVYREGTGFGVQIADNDWSLHDTDLVELSLHDAIAACDSGELNLLPLHKMFPAGVNSPHRNISNSIQPCSLGHSVWATVPVFSNAHTIASSQPKLIQDFFNVDAFPGRRAMRKSPRALAEWALLNSGYAINQIYPVLSSELAWEYIENSLSAISTDIVWVDSDEQALALVEDGVAAFAVVSSRNLVRKIATQPNSASDNFGVIWHGAIAHMSMLGIPKQAAADEALQLLRFLTEPGRNLHASTRVGYAPVQKDQVGFIEPRFRRALPVGGQARNLIWANSKWWRENGSFIEAEFSRYIDQSMMHAESDTVESFGS